MKCEDCNDRGLSKCCCTVDVDCCPDGTFPCKYCNSEEDLYMEFPKCGDWKTGEFVVRIGCLCEENSLDFDRTYKWRTDFDELSGALMEWNEMNTEGEDEMTEESAESMFSQWETEFYDKVDHEGLVDCDYASIAIGFFIAKGLTVDQSVRVYYDYCVKKGKY